MARVIVCSKGKPNTISATRYFAESGFTDYTVVVCADDDIEAYRKNVAGQVVAVPANCTNLSLKKQWILDNLVKRGEWVISIDDNVEDITCIDKSLYYQAEIPKPQHKDYNKKITVQEFIALAERDIKYCDDNGIAFAGFASNANPFFRKKKYRTVGFVWGKVCLMKSVGLPWITDIREMDDYAYTSINLLYRGKVLINNYIYPNAKRYEAVGGTGTYEKRLPTKIAAVQKIMRVFDGMYRLVDRPNLAHGAEIRMRFSNEKQVKEWATQLKKQRGKK